MFFCSYSIGWFRDGVSKFSLFLISKEFYTLMFKIKKKTNKTQRQVNQIQVKSQLLHWFHINKILFVLQKYPIEHNLQKHILSSCIQSRIAFYIRWIWCFHLKSLKLNICQVGAARILFSMDSKCLLVLFEHCIVRFDGKFFYTLTH